jgi:omega-hydroxy-beta-dihydromenaquinone-9 sulfotransferase
MDYDQLRKKSLLVTKEPLAGTDLKTIFMLLKQNRYYVSIPYFPRLIYSLFLSIILSPFRFRDRRFMKRMADKINVDKSPVFLLGHWRGGTTYLHNMLSKDDQFGFFSTFDAYLPGACIKSESLLKGIVAGSLPKTRPMDDVRMGADLPQEEEYAIGGTSVYSYYHGWCFPQGMDLYDRYVWLDDVDPEVIDDFKRAYMYLLKVATFKNDGRRLLLKNPSNTARVDLLLDMFPDAKFIHIHRNPYHQYLSMVRFMQKVIPLYCLQIPPVFDRVEMNLFGMYEHMYKKYLKDRELIPKGNLVEVSYEDFVSDPESDLERIYEVLSLPGFSNVKDRFHAYMLTQSEIHPMKYTISDEVREKVVSHWGFAFDAFGYDR